MTMPSNRLDRFTANLALNGFLFPIIACGMLEAQLFKVNAGIRPHLIVTIVGGIICVIALRRCRVWWPGLVGDRPGTPLSLNTYSARQLFSCAMLAGAGVVLGLISKSGSSFLFALLIMGLMFAPWSRIELCRAHFFAASASMAAGAILSHVLIKGDSSYLIIFFDAWALLISGIAALLGTYRKPYAMPQEATRTPELDQRPGEDATAHN